MANNQPASNLPAQFFGERGMHAYVVTEEQAIWDEKHWVDCWPKRQWGREDCRWLVAALVLFQHPSLMQFTLIQLDYDFQILMIPSNNFKCLPPPHWDRWTQTGHWPVWIKTACTVSFSNIAAVRNGFVIQLPTQVNLPFRAAIRSACRSSASLWLWCSSAAWASFISSEELISSVQVNCIQKRT